MSSNRSLIKNIDRFFWDTMYVWRPLPDFFLFNCHSFPELMWIPILKNL